MQRLVHVEGRRDRPKFGIMSGLTRRVDGEAVAVGVLLADRWVKIIELLQTTALARDDPLLGVRRHRAVLGQVVVVFICQTDIIFIRPIEALLTLCTQTDEDLLADLHLLEAQRLAVTGGDRRLDDALELGLLDQVEVFIGR